MHCSNNVESNIKRTEYKDCNDLHIVGHHLLIIPIKLTTCEMNYYLLEAFLPSQLFESANGDKLYLFCQRVIAKFTIRSSSVYTLRYACKSKWNHGYMLSFAYRVCTWAVISQAYPSADFGLLQRLHFSVLYTDRDAHSCLITSLNSNDKYSTLGCYAVLELIVWSTLSTLVVSTVCLL